MRRWWGSTWRARRRMPRRSSSTASLRRRTSSRWVLGRLLGRLLGWLRGRAAVVECVLRLLLMLAGWVCRAAAAILFRTVPLPAYLLACLLTPCPGPALCPWPAVPEDSLWHDATGSPGCWPRWVLLLLCCSCYCCCSRPPCTSHIWRCPACTSRMSARPHPTSYLPALPCPALPCARCPPLCRLPQCDWAARGRRLPAVQNPAGGKRVRHAAAARLGERL